MVARGVLRGRQTGGRGSKVIVLADDLRSFFEAAAPRA
jgi:hypothetical protein